jgi:hypothetical protein
MIIDRTKLLGYFLRGTLVWPAAGNAGIYFFILPRLLHLGKAFGIGGMSFFFCSKDFLVHDMAAKNRLASFLPHRSEPSDIVR